MNLKNSKIKKLSRYSYELNVTNYICNNLCLNDIYSVLIGFSEINEVESLDGRTIEFIYDWSVSTKRIKDINRLIEFTLMVIGCGEQKNNFTHTLIERSSKVKKSDEIVPIVLEYSSINNVTINELLCVNVLDKFAYLCTYTINNNTLDSSTYTLLVVSNGVNSTGIPVDLFSDKKLVKKTIPYFIKRIHIVNNECEIIPHSYSDKIYFEMDKFKDTVLFSGEFTNILYKR